MNSVKPVDLLILNAEQVLCFQPSDAETAVLGWDFRVLQNTAIAIKDGKIYKLGSPSEVEKKCFTTSSTQVIDASGKVVLPGFVDSHTHPVFFGTRESEFEMRIQGKSYEEIARAGGGIRSSVHQLRQASKEELLLAVRRQLHYFLEYGTTTIEAKSGYGLSFADEVKSLEVIRELNQQQPLELIPTFLGAHEVPDEYRHNRQKYIDIIVHEMIPYVSENNLAEFCDVFCEKQVFSIEESRRILLAAKEAGLKIKLHADQLHQTGAAELAAELGATSADHLEKVSEAGIAALAHSGTVAGLLPGSVFFLSSQNYPPARRLIQAGVPVALATDFNPGTCMSQSMPMMLTLAGLFMKMTPAEAIVAATANGAKAVDRGNQLGNLAEGKPADLVIWNVSDYRQIPYHFGVNLVNVVIKNGKIVVQHKVEQFQ